MQNGATIKYVVLLFAFVLCVSIGNNSMDVTNNPISVEPTTESITPIQSNYVVSSDTDDYNITSDTTLSDSFLSLKRGISVQNGATLVLDNMTIELNNDDYSVCSIEVQTGCTIVIDDCYIYPNASSSNSFSFNWLTDSFGNITDSTVEESYFFVFRADFIVVYNNTFIDIPDALNFRGSHNCTIELNNITTQMTRAIDYYYGSEYCHNITIKNNDFYGSSQTIVGYGDNAYVGYNRVHENGFDALTLGFGDDCIVEWNTIESPGRYGINFYSMSNFELRGNNITNAGGHGIWLQYSDNGLIEHNVVTGSTNDALYLANGCQNGDIFNNTLIKAGLHGLALNDSDNWEVRYNAFYWNYEGNIDITSGGTGNTIDNGTIGNFWGPSGHDNMSHYYDGPDSATDWIGGGTYDVYSGITLMAQDNYPILMNQLDFLTIQSTTITSPLLIYGIDLIVLGEQLIIQQGIYIYPDDTLILAGTQIDFQTGGAYWQTIEVQTGGHLGVWGGATFTSDQTSQTYGFGFRSGSSLFMNDVTVSRCGYPNNMNDPVFKVNITDASLSNMTISDAYLGLYLYYASGLTVSDIHFENTGYALWLNNNHNSIVEGITFTNVATAIYPSNSNNLTIRDCKFEGLSTRGIWPANVDNSHYYNNTFVDVPTCIEMNSGCTGNEIYMNFFSGETTYLIDGGSGNTMHNGTHGNFYLDYAGYDDDGNLIGDTTYSANGVTDPYPTMVYGSWPSSSGWNITTETWCLSTNYTMNGNATIYDGSTFCVFNATFWFDCSADNEYGLYVKNGGFLEFNDGSIRAYDISNQYEIIAYSASSVYMNGTSLIGVYHTRIETTSAMLSNLVISDAYSALEIYGADGITISGIHFVDSSFGLDIVADDIVVEGLTFDNVNIAITASNSQNLTIRNCDFEGANSWGLYFANVDDCDIYNNTFVDITSCIRFNTLCENNEVYVNFFSGETTYLLDQGTGNTMHNGTHGNFYLDCSVLDDDGNFIGDTTYSANGATDPYPYMVWGILPSASGWDLTSTTFCLAINYTFTGDVTIYDGTTLYVYGATLWFDCSSNREFGLTINDGGKLNYTDGALRAYDGSYRFDVLASTGSEIVMQGTLLNGSYHIRIETNSTSLSDLTITNTWNGIHVAAYNLEGFILDSISVSDAENSGFYIEQCSNVILQYCDVSDSKYGIYMLSSSDIDFLYMTFSSLTEDAIRMNHCTDITISETFATNVDNGVYITSDLYGFLIVEDSGFEHVVQGVNIQSSSQHNADVTLDNITVRWIDATGWGVTARSINDLTIVDCVFNAHGGSMINLGTGIVGSILIDNCDGFNGTTGVYTYGYFTNIINCNFLNFTYGIDHANYGSTSGNLNVTDNYFYGCWQSIIAQGSMMHIVHNTFEYCDTGVNTRKTAYLVVANNTLTNMVNGVISGPQDVNITVYGNVYSIFTADAIAFGSNVQMGIIYNETIDDCRYGIYLYQVDGVTIDLVEIFNAERGIWLSYATNSTISNADIQDCDSGLYIYYSEESEIRDCTITSCTIGIELDYNSFETTDHDIDTSNTFDGKTIYYLFNQTDVFLNNIDTYHLSLMYCDYVTVNGSIIDGDTPHFYYTTNTTITNCTISSDITIEYCEDFWFLANTFTAASNIMIQYTGSPTNVTFTLNSFLTQYSFAGSDLNLNASVYGNYWYDYPYDVDDNHDGIGDIPFSIASMMDYLPLFIDPYDYDLVIVFYSPTEGSYVSSTFHVSAMASILYGVLYPGTVSIIVNIGFNSFVLETGGPRTIELDIGVSGLADGPQNVTITGTGGINPVRMWSANVEVIIDNSGPTFDIALVDNYVTSSTSISVTGSVSDTLSGVAWVMVYVDGVGMNYTSSFDSISHEITFTTEKSYNVTILASNVAGATSSLTRTIYYDNTAPDVSSPDDVILEVGETEILSWTVTDLTPSHYNISIGVSYLVGANFDSGTITFDIPTDLAEGTHNLLLQVYDRAGHMTSDVVQITISEGSTTPTGSTTTETTTTPTTPTTTIPPDDGMIVIIIVLVAGIGAGIVIIVVIVVMRKRVSA